MRTTTCRLPLCALLVFVISLQVSSAQSLSPLSAYSPLWNQPQYRSCNTAAKATYMTPEERKVIYILNCARKNPKLFLETVIKKYPEKSGKGYLVNIDYYKSLCDTFRVLKPLPILKPDSLCFVSAECHAMYAGQTSYTGHVRSDECQKKMYYNAECCDYGYKDALDILMHLLIDDGVVSLGHREACLDSYYKKLGVAIRPHNGYGWNAVLDFKF